ncbi:MAG: SpoIIE family protein phosphatase [Clostridia bacterium]|nr:SpoIIE family protein phosphatase [Clostridia bacterium]
MSRKRQGRNATKYILELGTFLGSLVLCRARVGENCAPFGLACMAAAELVGVDPIFAGAGVVMGAFLSGEPLWGVMIAAAAFVLFTRLIQAFLGEVSLSARMLVFLLCEIAVLPFEMVLTWQSAAYALLSLALSAVAVVLLSRTLVLLSHARRLRVLGEREQMLLAASFGLLLLGLGDLSAAGVSLPVVLLDTAALLLVFCKGPGGLVEGIVAAALLAFGLEAGTDLMGITALCALMAALTSGYGRGAAAGSFLMTAAVQTFFLGPEAESVALGSAFLGCLCFLVLPVEWMDRAETALDSRRYREKNGAEAMDRLRQRMAAEVEEAARLCGALSGLFDREKEQGRFVVEWPLGAARRVCVGCEGRVLCQRDMGQFDRAVLHLLSAYDRGDPVQPVSPMDSHCRFFREMMTAAYQSYNQAFAHEAGLRRAAEQNAYMNRQLCGVSAMLSLLSTHLREDRWGDERVEGALFPYLIRRGFAPLSVDAFYRAGRLCLSIRVGRQGNEDGTELLSAVERRLRRTMRLIAVKREAACTVFEMEALRGLTARMARISLPEQEETVSGDETGELRMPSGKVVYAVSDGMGSGEAANRESRAAIELLFDQFRLGVERELIYENVNRLLIARGEKEIYATLDAASIDLVTGEAEMVKFGAPPTCLVRAGNVRMLAGEALPCGIVDEARPYIRRIRLRQRDRLVFCTDGVYDLLGKELEAELKKDHDAPLEQMAESLMAAAQLKGQRDDMTVMVVEVA